MGIFRRSTVALAAAATLVGAPSLQAQEQFFQGTATGCFFPVSGSCAGGGGTVFANLAYSSGTFAGTTLNGFLGIGGVVSNFGVFTLLPGTATNYTGTPFQLDIAFSVPTGVSPDAMYTASLRGSASSLGVGGVTIDFDNAAQQFVIAGGGSFTLQVNDLTVESGLQNLVSGEIAYVVPEPATMLLLGSGLVGLVPAYRRRRSA